MMRGDAVAGVPLLAANEPPPFALENPSGTSSILLVCEHGGHRIPESLGTLGLDKEHHFSHFMWDLGALNLARALSRTLDAPLAHQPYSRMVCDCNRRPDVESFIPDHGEGIPVPANASLSPTEKQLRETAIWKPFHDHVAHLLDQRLERETPTILATIHSFTPVFHGEVRHWHAGVLYDQDPDLSPALFAVLEAEFGDFVGANEPYDMNRETDYTVPIHGEDRHLPCTEIEVRNDLLLSPKGVAYWAHVLAAALRASCAKIGMPIGA